MGRVHRDFNFQCHYHFHNENVLMFIINTFIFVAGVSEVFYSLICKKVLFFFTGIVELIEVSSIDVNTSYQPL